MKSHVDFPNTPILKLLIKALGLRFIRFQAANKTSFLTLFGIPLIQNFKVFNKWLIAEVVSRALVAAAFLAVAVWFVSLVPGAIDRELQNADARVAAHLEMLTK